jgi:hypothetical protein
MRKGFIVLMTLIVFCGSGIGLFAEEKPIKIGMYADLSAGTAQWGTDAEKGAKLRE